MSESPRLVRFLVGVQRRPATTMIAVNFFLLTAGAVASAAADGQVRDWTTIGWLAFVACASTATAESLSCARSLWSRVAVVGIGTGATLPAAQAVFGTVGSNTWPLVLAVVAAAVALPHATIAVASRFHRLTRSGWRIAITLGAVACFVAGGLMDKVPATIAVRIACFVGWLLATEIAFHAAAAASVRMRWILLEVAVASIAGSMALQAAERQHGLAAAYAIALGAGWLLGALLVPVARLGRSFTAVPLDHPIYTDFGGPRPG